MLPLSNCNIACPRQAAFQSKTAGIARSLAHLFRHSTRGHLLLGFVVTSFCERLPKTALSSLSHPEAVASVSDSLGDSQLVATIGQALNRGRASGLPNHLFAAFGFPDFQYLYYHCLPSNGFTFGQNFNFF